MLNLSQPSQARQALPAVDCVLWAVGFERNSNVAREEVWIDGLRRLVESLAPSPRRFIYVSSTSVYGDSDGNTVDESTPPQPVTEGGRCCRQAEVMLRELCQLRHPSSELVVLRMAGIYGPNRLLRKITDLKSQTPLPVAPDGPLNLIHVDDAARVIDAVRNADTVPPLMNVVNAGTLTRREYYSTLAALVNAPPPVFADSPSVNGRGGNKVVTSCLRDKIPVDWQFDDVRDGLRHAVANRDL